MIKLTEDEKWAEHDCVCCEYSEYDDAGNFVKCISEDNSSGRPLIECQYQKPSHGLNPK